jgi:S1-C subfamily serine protease
MTKTVAILSTLLFVWITLTVGLAISNQHPTLEDNINSTVVIVSGNGSGSGVLINPNQVLTAFHVPMADANSPDYVIFKNSGRATIKTKIVASSYEQDLIVMNLDKPNTKVKPVNIDCGLPDVGDEVYAVGEPEGFWWMVRWGHVVDPENSIIREGEFRLPSDYIKEEFLFTIDLNMMHGNSGGGIFNQDTGNLIGIASQMWLKQFADKTGETQQLYMQMGFPVRGNVICKFLDDNKISYTKG